jgi:uncharacterized protein (DUF305 family)
MPSIPQAFRYAIAAVVALLSVAAAASIATLGHRMSAHAAAVDQQAFLAENDQAMSKMMAGMEVKPTGVVDADFAAMMIPHHQGAIDMAQAELRHGGNEQLRRIAQEIIVDQLQEIAAMRLALGQPLPPSIAAPTEGTTLRAPVASPQDIVPLHSHERMNNH